MAPWDPPILLLDRKITSRELFRVRQAYHDLVKITVDLPRRVYVAGGESHFDGRDLLIDSGSRPEDVWGVDFYPDEHQEQCLDFCSSVNQRTDADSPYLRDEDLCRQIRELVFELVGSGTKLPWED
jgi:hypothetical protein